MKLNKATPRVFTKEGASACHINPEQQLRRSVMACMLWEKSFYEDGMSVPDRIAQLVPQILTDKLYNIVTEARDMMKLRHVPLLIVREMARHKQHKQCVADLLCGIIQRPDELTEFLAIYWKDGRTPLSAQVKKGLAQAFLKFDEYQLAKYNRPDAIKLRDVLRLVHPRPKDAEQDNLFRKLKANELQTPETWEVLISACKTPEEKQAAWVKLISEKKLGALALLRNLRNMDKVGVNMNIVEDALNRMKVDRVLPFRFIAAARTNPFMEPALDNAMLKCLVTMTEKLKGKTVLLIDVSGSMDWKISDKSDITRMDAACGIAMLARELCEEVEIYSFSQYMVQVPLRRGFALRDAIVSSQSHGGTYLGQAVATTFKDRTFDRLIVFTDEQSHDVVPQPTNKLCYMINVACEINGVGYGGWTHIDGFSEATIQYIVQAEKTEY